MKRLRILGHSIHPITTVFPLSLQATGLVFDVVSLASPTPERIAIARWCVGAAATAGLVAALGGLWEWLAIPERGRAKRAGLRHGISSLTTLALLGGSWALRRGHGDAAPVPALLLALLAAGTVVVAIRLGEATSAPREDEGPRTPSARQE